MLGPMPRDDGVRVVQPPPDGVWPRTLAPSLRDTGVPLLQPLVHVRCGRLVNPPGGSGRLEHPLAGGGGASVLSANPSLRRRVDARSRCRFLPNRIRWRVLAARIHRRGHNHHILDLEEELPVRHVCGIVWRWRFGMGGLGGPRGWCGRRRRCRTSGTSPCQPRDAFAQLPALDSGREVVEHRANCARAVWWSRA